MPEVELHQFGERLFVTGPSWGVELPPGASPRDVGRLMLRGLAGEQARERPFIEAFGLMLRRDRAEERGWERFCRRVVGVDVAVYRPQVRIELLDLGEPELRLRALGGRVDGESGIGLPRDVGAEALGRAALSMLATTPPRWPAVRTAIVHVATRKRLVVYPSRFRAGEPVRVVAADGDAHTIGEVVRQALEDSDRIDPEGERDSWERLLATVDITPRQIAGRRSVHVYELSNRGLRIAVWRPVRGGWEPVGEVGELVLPDLGARELGRAVVAAAVAWDPWSGEPLRPG
jgi:hypothetical protein